MLDSSAFAGADALPDLLRCDICIIGTGPAGATIARELSNTPFGSPSWRVAAQSAKKRQMLLTKLRASGGLEKWTNGWSAIES